MRFRLPHFYLFLALLAIPVFGWLIWRGTLPETLTEELASFEKLGESVQSSLQSLSVLSPKEAGKGYVVEDTTKAGIAIAYAKEGEETLETEEEKGLKLTFPENIGTESLSIALPSGNEIKMLGATEDGNYSVSTVSADAAVRETSPTSDQMEGLLERLFPTREEKYLRYESEDGRKVQYYAYQIDSALGEKKLKHWTLYETGNGKEEEKYTFENALLKRNDDGSVSVYYFDAEAIKNNEQAAGVESNLLERASRVLAKDAEEGILNGDRAPDAVIPAPYIVTSGGETQDLTWLVGEDRKTLSVLIEVEKSAYPIALDPTLQFTAPGQSNTGNTITGETANGYLGIVMATADLNADGKIDFLVSASGYNSGAGRVYIFYNDGSLPQSAVGADHIITGENDFNHFGRALAPGDFNNDGKTDLAVGAYGYDFGANDGRVYLFYFDGSPPTTAASADVTISGTGGDSFGSALTAGDFNTDGETDLAVGAYAYSASTGRVYIYHNDGSYPTTQGTADITITGGATSNQFGEALASGDLNSDGRMDLIVGAPGYSTFTGRAYIFHNDGSIPTTAGTADVTITGNATVDIFGDSFAIGDFNADGRTDLAVGAYGYSSSAGRAYIFHNDGSIPTTAGTADITITGESSSTFGVALMSGDFNMDGRTDLAIGAPAYSTSVGRAYLFYNDGSIPTTAATADVIITGEGSSNFGSALAAGDLNADGRTDLAVGAQTYATSLGRAYIFYSQNGQVNTNLSITGGGSSDVFGYALATGDLNSDGWMDLIVGAYGVSSDAGAAYIFYGDGQLPTTYTNADVTITGNAAGDLFGVALGTGDFNADGRTDLVVGASGYTTSTGRAYIFHNDGSIPTTAATADITITGAGTNNSFGTGFVSGDFNADGEIDLAVSAYQVTSSTGSVYLFYNDGSIPTAAGSADLTIAGPGTSSSFGIGFEGGDFNSDGKIDLAVGAYQRTSNTGSVYLFYNDGSIPTTAGTADVTITGNATSDSFGHGIASGDFNADGRTDLAVGAFGYSTDTGRAYIFHNDGSIPTTAGTADVTITGETTDTRFGYSMTAGDFNADGRTDLVVGGYEYSSNIGRAYLFYNDGTLPTEAASSDAILTGITSSAKRFGHAFVAEDLNNDGRTDLIVGASGFGSVTGIVYIYETRENFAWNLQKISPAVGLSVNSNVSGQELTISGRENENSAATFAIGDFNADGKTDLAMGAFNWNSATGRAYIFYNDGSLPEGTASADVMITGETTSNWFGISTTAGDLNADGRIDLVVGSDEYSSSSGRAYIFYNDGSYPPDAASADVKITGEATSSFSYALQTGDVNADGKTDLIVGAYNYSSATGRAYIFHNDGSIPTAAGSADVIITGGATSNNFGHNLTTGDFNADGKTDLAVGAYGYSSTTGRAYIFYNDGSIPTTAGTADVTITGGATGNAFGRDLSAGDFNYDGEVDLAVGAYNTTNGTVYIFHNDGSIPTTAGTADVTITGNASGDGFGEVLASGDLNSDGRTDLVVGAENYSSQTGRAYVFFNDGSIPTTAATADLTFTGTATGSYFGTALGVGDISGDNKADLIIGATGVFFNRGRTYIYTLNDTVITGNASGDYFGYSLASGDFNADGRTDIAVGAALHSTSTGRAYIFYSDGSIPTTAGTADVTITGETTSNAFGASLAAGDFNADGKTDLAVGAPDYTSFTGRAYIFHNDGSIPTTAATADVTITGETTTNRFGVSLAAGDFNSDGETDLAVGAISYSTATGRAYIFHNDGSIPTTAATADVIITGEAASNQFGISLAAGDFNTDGKTDLAVGAYTYSGSSGRVYIFHNDGSIPTTAATADVIITGESTSTFGYAMTAGDLNADGKTDLAIGANQYDSNTGRAYIFYSDGSIPTTAGTADVIISGEATVGTFGNVLANGDFNSDGKTDLVVGANSYSSQTGRAYMFYNDGSIPTTAATADIIMTGTASGENLGFSFAVADLNVDSITDLVVGLAGYNTDVGRVIIFLSEAAEETPQSAAKVRGTVKTRGTIKVR